MYVLQNVFVLKNEFFYTVIFLTELNLKGDTNIYFKQITFFEKKKDFVKIIHIFSLTLS